MQHLMLREMMFNGFMKRGYDPECGQIKWQKILAFHVSFLPITTFLSNLMLSSIIRPMSSLPSTVSYQVLHVELNHLD
jgi:hypothetical protein